MLRQKRELIQTGICIASLFVVPLLLATPAIKRGELPVDMTDLTTRTPWQEARSVGVDSSSNDAASPFIDRYYPWYAFMNQAGMKHELPLWNPYESFGIPFLALWRSRVLSPFSLPVYVLPLHTALGVSVFLKILVAGLCAYYAARRFLFTPPYAVLPAITFQMSGFFLVGHWHPAADVIPWFPLLLPFLQRMLLGDYRAWPYIALLVGIMTFGGDPETLTGILLFMFALTFVYGIRTYTPRHVPKAMTVLAISVALGLALATVQLAPFFEFLKHGNLSNEAPSSFHISDLAMLLAPQPQSNTITTSSWLPAGIVGFFLLPLWLAVRPATNRTRKRRLEAFLLTTLSLLVLACFSPLFRHIPGLAQISTWNFAAPFPFALGLLAATAADEWVHLDADTCKRALKQLTWLLPLFWVPAFLISLLLAPDTPSDTLVPNTMMLTVVAAFVIFSLLLMTAFWPKEKLLIYSLSLTTATLSWCVYAPSNLATPADHIFPDTHFIRTLHGLGSRVAGTLQLRGWPISPYQIAQTYSPSGVILNRSQNFMEQANEQPKLLRLSGAEALLLTKEDVQERFSPLRPMLNIQEVFPSGAILLKDLQANKRVYVAHAGRSLDVEAKQFLRASGPPLLEGGVLPESVPNSASATATITAETFNTMHIAATTNQPGVLVVNDSWYPGWHAVVDGTSAFVFPVDISFRGIEISEGNHEISFYYAPSSLIFGGYASLAALAIILFGIGTQYRSRRRR